jgi:hypothetical protein
MKKGLILAAFFILALAVRAHSLEFVANPRIIPGEYFGLHIHRAATTTPVPAIPFGSWRLWDAAVSWSNLEPEQGKWDFGKLDKLVSLAESRKIDVLLTLGLTPPWASARPTESSTYGPGLAAEPKSINDWKRYVETVAKRYKGRIRGYEIWNEPNLVKFYSGTPREMVSLAREAYGIIKAIDPNAVVVSPSPTTKNGLRWLKEYFSWGGGNYCDVIGYHLYVMPSPPEETAQLMAELKVLTKAHGLDEKPIWNTEAGWSIKNQKPYEGPDKVLKKNEGLEENQAAAYVARAYVVNWAIGAGRFYWYAWDNWYMGLTEIDGKTVKNPGKTYGVVYEWLVGSRMTGCGSDFQGTWKSEIERDGGYRAWIVWKPSGKVLLSPPEEFRQFRDVTGKKYPVKQGEKVEIGPSPVLLETRDP